MRELGELLAVLAALHLAFGAHWVRRTTFAFRAWFGRRLEAVPGSRPWGSDRMALLLAPPLPFAGAFHLAEIDPVSIGRAGVLAYCVQQPNPGGRVPEEARFVRWEDLGDVRADGRRVCAGGTKLARASSPAVARRIAGRLQHARGLAADEREAAIAADVARALDENAARERVAAFRRASRRLAAPAAGLFLLLFVALPAVGFTLGLGLAWPALLAALLVLQFWSTAAFVRAHRVLHPGAQAERRALALSVALSPLEALRAGQILGRDLLAGFHPLAAAAALLEPRRLEPFAAGVLRDALHPLPPACPVDDPEAVETERAARERLVRALRSAAERLGLPADLGTRPPAADADERTWCPRCLRTYLLESGTCSECWDLPLARTESGPRAQPTAHATPGSREP